MEDEDMAFYLALIQSDEELNNLDEDDEDWVLDDEYELRSSRGGPQREGPVEAGSLADLLSSTQEPRLPPSPDAALPVDWLTQFMQDDPRYSEHHNIRMEIIQKMLHPSGRSQGGDFLSYMNRGMLHP